VSTVSIVVPTKNEEKHIEDCLRSCVNQTYKNVELIVVDNHSTDQTRSIARNYTRRVFKKGPERSSQKNFGAQKAAGEYLLFLDADARLSKDVVTECVDMAQKKNLSMVIIPERHVGEGFWAEVKALERSFYLGDDTVEAPWFFRKKDFLSVGGYDEELFAGEDWDLFDRMRKKNFKYDRCKSFIDHHIEGVSLKGLVKKKYHYGTNIRRLLAKNAKRGIGSNPLIRPSILRNARYLFTSPTKYLAIFGLKFLETTGILAGMVVSSIKGSRCPKEELSKLMVDVFYDRKKSVELSQRDWTAFLKLCSGNRVLYQIAKKLQVQEILAAAEKEVQKTQKTLDFVAAQLPQALLVKTYKFIPYITYDLDLLVHDRAEAERALSELKRTSHPGKQDRYQKNYFRDDLLRIDLHEDFYWQGFRFVDIDEVFKNTQKVEYFGRQVMIPNYTIEFLLNCAHILFEKRYITLLDYWYLKKLIEEKNLDWTLIERQTRKYGWQRSFNLLQSKLRQINVSREPFPGFITTTGICKIYGEKCRHEKKLPLFDIFYYAFARARGRLGIKTRYPYYLHWFEFKKLP
jgi:glycosyltransferase involved in cell wall biosynthesis